LIVDHEGAATNTDHDKGLGNCPLCILFYGLSKQTFPIDPIGIATVIIIVGDGPNSSRTKNLGPAVQFDSAETTRQTRQMGPRLEFRPSIRLHSRRCRAKWTFDQGHAWPVPSFAGCSFPLAFQLEVGGT